MTPTTMPLDVIGHMLKPRLEFRGVIFGVRIYEVNAGTIHSGRRPTEMLVAILDFSHRVRADNRGESALILSSAEYLALAAELQAADEILEAT